MKLFKAKVFKAQIVFLVIKAVFLFCLLSSSFSIANSPYYKKHHPVVPIINGEYIGTLHYLGQSWEISMTVSGNDQGLGHYFALMGAGGNQFLISGNCECLESGAILGPHGLFSNCLGADMALMDQVNLSGWFTDHGYRGEIKIYSSSSEINFPDVQAIFELKRR